MALSLSAYAKLEKNKLASTSVWIVLLKITLPDTTILRLSSDNTNTTWSGETWTAFPFDMEEIGEASKGEVPQVEIMVGNATKVMQTYMEAANGGVGSDVAVYVVNSGNLGEATPEFTGNFRAINAYCDPMWAHFVLGASNPYRKRFPLNRMLKTFCRYGVTKPGYGFKGDRCQYAGAETTCDRSLARCRELNNSHHFGGAPGAGRRGLYV